MSIQSSSVLRVPLFPCAALAIACGAALASPLAMAAPQKLETVYISATRSETELLPLASQIHIIDAEEIRLSGAQQLAEVLRLQPGLQLTDSDGSGGRNVTVSMRGLSGANNVLVLVDGRRLNNASLAAPALTTLALKDIERIEIVQGSASVMFGDQAVGGVINVVTRRATAGELRGYVQVTGGSNDLESYTAGVNQGFDNGLSYVVSAQKRRADNFRDNNNTNYENVLGNLRYDFAAGHVFAEMQRIDDRLRLPGSLLDDVAAQNPRQTLTPNDYANQKTDLLRIGGALSLNDSWQLLIDYADREEESEAFYDDYVPPHLYAWFSQSRMDVTNLSPRLVGRVAMPAGEAVVTLGYDLNEADYASRDGFSRFSQEVDGFYGQAILPVGPGLNVTLGAREAGVDDRNPLAGTAHDDKARAYEAGASYQFSPASRVFVRYAEAFRFANADENAQTLDEVEFLDVQTSDSVELGYAWQDSGRSASVLFYRMTLDNEIAYDPLAGDWGANINLPETERQGVVIEASEPLSVNLHLRLNYTYTDAELSEGIHAGNDAPFVAKNTGNLALVYQPTAEVSVQLDANYTGSRYRTGDEANLVAKVDGQWLLNANLLWNLDGLELGLRVKNLTDEDYADFYGVSWRGNYQYPQPGRQYEASLTYRF